MEFIATHTPMQTHTNKQNNQTHRFEAPHSTHMLSVRRPPAPKDVLGVGLEREVHVTVAQLVKLPQLESAVP